jgi:hypothetical protein
MVDDNVIQTQSIPDSNFVDDVSTHTITNDLRQVADH